MREKIKRALFVIKSDGKFLIATYALALLIRLALVGAFGDFQNPEMYEHGKVARNMLDGRGFSMHWHITSFDPEMIAIKYAPPKYEGAFLPPLSPYLIYANFLVFGDGPLAYGALMLINCVVNAFFPVFAFLIARKLGGEASARLAALAAIAFLPAAYSVVTFSGSAIYIALTPMIVYFGLLFYEKTSYKYAILLGLFCGVNALLRSEFLAFGAAFGVLIALLALMSNRVKLKESLALALVFLIFASIPTAPWIWRNTKLFGKFTTIISHPWYEIFRGNNQLSGGGLVNKYGFTTWPNWDNFPEIIAEADSIPYNQKYEIKVDEVFKNQVLQFWQENPPRGVWIMINRAFRLWTIDSSADLTWNWRYAAFLFLLYIPVYIGIASSFARAMKKRQFAAFAICFAMLAFYTFLFGISNIDARYQIYFVSIAAPFAGIGWKKILRLK